MESFKVFLICCVYSATLLPMTRAQFPRACINLKSLQLKECCPIPSGLMAPCGSDAGRGKCLKLKGRRWANIYENYDETQDLDDRHNWPLGFFERACHCKPNFAGFDCSKCEFGYHGQGCKQRKTMIRRNFSRLSDEEKHKYMRYINMSKFTFSKDYVVATSVLQDIKESLRAGVELEDLFVNVTVYDLFVWLHFYATGDISFNIPDFGHSGQGFPTFHRGLILTWERALQDVTGDQDFTIPFWDWRDNNECDICTRDFLGESSYLRDGSVKGKYFDSWYTVCLDEANDTRQMYLVLDKGARICDPRNHVPGLIRLSSVEKARTFNGSNSVFAFPTKDEVNFALRFELYDQSPYNAEVSCCFRNLLEGFASTDTGHSMEQTVYMHNRVHVLIGGYMAISNVAPNDPLFPLHHSFVDWILEKWLRKHKKTASVLTGTQAPIGHNRDSPIVPIFPVRTHGQLFRQSFALGYDYEDLDEDGFSPGDEVDDLSTSDLGCCTCNSATRSRCRRLKDYHKICHHGGSTYKLHDPTKLH